MANEQSEFRNIRDRLGKARVNRVEKLIIEMLNIELDSVLLRLDAIESRLDALETPGGV